MARAFLFFVMVLIGAVLLAVVLSFMSAPQPSCANGPVTISDAAADSLQAKWDSFLNSLDRGAAATVNLTEEELTSSAIRFINDNQIPAKDVQVHLCSGEGKGQATGKVSILNQDIDVFITGHLDLDKDPPDLVVDQLGLGRVPQQLTTWLAQTIIDITRIGEIEIPSGINEAITSSKAVTLSGRR
jgi:hypothetical protein